MKLRQPWMINLAAFLGAGVLRAWMGTIICRVENLGQATDPWDPTTSERFIYAFWHENLLSLGKFSSAAPASLLTSRSADGELISKLANHCGVKTIRGSSSNGGMDALEELIALGKTSHITIAPDGPRGPRRVVKRGLAYLASWSQMRIVPLGIAFGRAWRAKSWDQTVLPRPFTHLRVVGAPVIHVPRDLGKVAMEQYRLKIEQSLNTATDLAEDWVQGRIRSPRWPDATTSEAAA